MFWSWNSLLFFSLQYPIISYCMSLNIKKKKKKTKCDFRSFHYQMCVFFFRKILIKNNGFTLNTWNPILLRIQQSFSVLFVNKSASMRRKIYVYNTWLVLVYNIQWSMICISLLHGKQTKIVSALYLPAHVLKNSICFFFWHFQWVLFF